MITLYEILNQGEIPEILIYDEVAAYGGLSAKQFRQDLKALAQNADTVMIRFNSPGGSVFEGAAIFNAIKDCKAKTIGHVDGVAASIAGYAFLACQERYMASNSFLMIHKVQWGAYGESSKLREAADLVDKTEGMLLSRLTALSGQDEEWVRQNWLKDNTDTWLTAEEALDAGLITGITDAVAEVNPENKHQVEAYQPALVNRFMEIRNQATQAQEPKKHKLMNKLQTLCNQLGITDVDFSDEETMIKTIKQKQADLAKANTDLEAEKERLSNQLQDILKSKNKELIDQAITEGRITEDQRPHFEVVAEKAGTDTLKAMLATMPKPKDLKNVKGRKPGSDATNELDPKGERKDWTFQDWSKKDPAKLKQMRYEEPEMYAELYEAQYGKAPQPA